MGSDLFSFRNQNLFCGGVVDILACRAAFDSVPNAFHDFVVLAQWGHRQAPQGVAIVFCDDDILRDIHQSTGQITRIGCLQGRVRQSFSGTVCRNEVLQNGESLLEVREDGVLNDVLPSRRGRLLRLGHQATHARQLTNLLLRSTCTRVHHHVNRVETLLVSLQTVHQDVGQARVCVRPDVNDLVVTLVVRDQTHVVVVHHLPDLRRGLFHQLFLFRWDDDVVQVERQSALEGHGESKLLDVVQELCCARNAHTVQHVGNDATQ